MHVRFFSFLANSHVRSFILGKACPFFLVFSWICMSVLLFDPFFYSRGKSSQHTYDLRQRENSFATASTVAASQSPRFVIPVLIDKLSEGIKSRFSTHSLTSTSNYAKANILESYSTNCSIENCYICNRPEIDKMIEITAP